MESKAEEREKLEKEVSSQNKLSNISLDYRMVSFSLAGKLYGIDIMQVKEIRKSKNFTYIPNISPYVKGVDNLRGEIIPIIDMRLMFDLPIPEVENNSLENVIVLRLSDQIIGIIVDSVEKVVSLSSSQIRPPHPLFGDINIKYIYGVVEHEKKMYVILDIIALFFSQESNAHSSQESAIEDEVVNNSSAEVSFSDWQREETSSVNAIKLEPLSNTEVSQGTGTIERSVSLANMDVESNNYQEEDRSEYNNKIQQLVLNQNDFARISQFLEKEIGLYLSPLNENWFKQNQSFWESLIELEYSQWQEKKEEIRTLFISPFSGQLWSEELIDEMVSILEDYLTTEILTNIYNPGCGIGDESYSISVAIRKAFGNYRYKIWASDNEISQILQTHSRAYDVQQLPLLYFDYMLNTKEGMKFDSEIRESILFELSDVTQPREEAVYGLIVAYDLLSFLSQEDQIKVLEIFNDCLDENGLLIVGLNEDVSSIVEGWALIPSEKLKIYRKQL